MTGSFIQTPTPGISVRIGEDTSVATPGDVAAIFMAVLYIVTVAMVVLVVAAVLICRHLMKKNMYDVRTNGDMLRNSSPEPEYEWQVPGKMEGLAVQARGGQDAVDTTKC